jgi:hypothetical protein
MKIGSQFFAILAVGALSTQVASAGHHGHRASTGAAASHSGTDAQSLAKSPLAGSRQGPGPALQGDIAEDGSGLTNTHKRNTDEAPAKTDTAPKTTPAATHGLQRAATPAPGADGIWVMRGFRSTPASPSIRAVKPSRSKTVGSIKTRPPLHRGSGSNTSPSAICTKDL